jgi:threonine dehydrogenase-like Zn-dependent dehydrogenase
VFLRQATTEGTVNIDNLVIGDSFSAVVPEPSTVMLVGLGLVGLLAIRRRK